MADELQKMLDAVRKASPTGAAATAVEEPPDEDSESQGPSLDRMLSAVKASPSATKSTAPANPAKPKDNLPPMTLDQAMGRGTPVKPLAEAATLPSLLPTQPPTPHVAAKLEDFIPPTEPITAGRRQRQIKPLPTGGVAPLIPDQRPGFVRGPVGLPIPSEPLQKEIDQEPMQRLVERERNAKLSAGPVGAPERIAAQNEALRSGKPLPDFSNAEERNPLLDVADSITAPASGPIEKAKQLWDAAMGRGPAPKPDTAGQKVMSMPTGVVTGIPRMAGGVGEVLQGASKRNVPRLAFGLTEALGGYLETSIGSGFTRAGIASSGGAGGAQLLVALPAFDVVNRVTNEVAQKIPLPQVIDYPEVRNLIAFSAGLAAYEAAMHGTGHLKIGESTEATTNWIRVAKRSALYQVPKIAGELPSAGTDPVSAIRAMADRAKNVASRISAKAIDERKNPTVSAGGPEVRQMTREVSDRLQSLGYSNQEITNMSLDRVNAILRRGDAATFTATDQERANLKQRGFSDNEIESMKPVDAARELAKPAATSATEVPTEPPATPTEALAQGLERTAKEVREAEARKSGTPQQPAEVSKRAENIPESIPEPKAKALASEPTAPQEGQSGQAVANLPKVSPSQSVDEAKSAGVQDSRELPMEPPAAGQAEPSASVPEAPFSQPAASPKLSRELAGAKPRYSYGSKQFDLKFESDLDKSLYILAQEKPSVRDADYLAFAKQHTGLADSAELRAHGKAIKDWIKREAKSAEPRTITVPQGAGRTTRHEPPAATLMEKAPPGGFTEADKVPEKYRKPATPQLPTGAAGATPLGVQAPNVERYQWLRNAEGGQTAGNQTEIRPLTEELFNQYVRPLTRANPNFQKYMQQYPGVTHIRLTRVQGQGEWKMDGSGTLDELRPYETTPRQTTDRSPWAKRVDSFESPEAKAQSAQSDSGAEGVTEQPPLNERRKAYLQQLADERAEATPERKLEIDKEVRAIRTTYDWRSEEGSTVPTQFGTGQPEEAKSTIQSEEAPTNAGPADSTSDRSLERTPSADVRAPGAEQAAPEQGGVGGEADQGGRVQSGGGRSGLPQRVGGREPKVRVPAERRGRSRAGKAAGSQSISRPEQSGADYRITDSDNLGAGGPKQKYADNLAAIRVLKQIESEGRQATPEEQAVLVKYVGWGGISQVFNSQYGEWGKEYKELEALLSEPEFDSARATTPNAHYTGIPVVRAMWDAVKRLGFEEGRFLEPSAGTGNFLGAIPDDLAPSVRRTAVEIDDVTGRILKQLYQSADVRIQGFEKFRGPNGFYDLIIGNVPFGDFKVFDPAYQGTPIGKFFIHNYFIVKSLDKLRPGGLAALITSSGTMDAPGNEKARLEFAKRAELVGAIRLPKNTFFQNARTDVTTDILFFRKLAEDEKPTGHKFIGTADVPSIEESETIPVNEYFAKHPEMMLGTMGYTGTRYAKGMAELTPDESRPLDTALPEAIAKLPEGVMRERSVPESTTIEAVRDAMPEFGDVKPNGLKLKDGNVYRRVGDALRLETDYPKTSVKRLKSMLRVRDAARELMGAELNDRPPEQLAGLRERLNKVYDEFESKNGPLHMRANQQAMAGDPDLPFLLALEKYSRETKRASKTDIFSKRTISPRKAVERVETAKDAMLVSLNEKGQLSFAHMAKISGRSEQELQAGLKAEGLVFESPEGHWETSDAYLSGNVRKKLEEAESAAKTDPRFEENVKALKAVQPVDLTPGEVNARLGAPWVPVEDVEDFIRHIIESPYGQVSVRHVASEGLWTVDASYSRSVAATQKWGTARMNAVDLIDAGLNQRSPIVYDSLGDGKKMVNTVETTAAKEKLENLQAEFRKFMMGDIERGNRLAQLYNEKYNSFRLREYDGAHLTLPGMTPEIALTKIQKDDIWRGVAGGNMGLYEPVGAGKTFIIVGTGMEWRRLGLARKVAYVVPNSTAEQFVNQFRTLYPAANVLATSKADFTADKRQEFVSRVATGDWDGVIIPFSQWTKIGVSDETFFGFLREQMAALSEFIEEMRAAEGKRGHTVKELEKAKKRLEERIQERLNQEKKDKAVQLEDLGIDGLIVDEAHAFKSLWFPTKMGRVPGVPRSESDRALDMYLKTQHITRLNNGRNVIFATGTPVDNTMAEMWNMMRYLDDERLKEMGMQHFDSWAAQFGQVVSNWEVRPETPTVPRVYSRFAKFQNIPELMKMFLSTGALHRRDQLGLKVPEMAGGKPKVIQIEPSQRTLEFIKELGKRADAIRGKKAEKGADNMLKITGDGRKVALDFRMISPSAEPDPDSKVNAVIREVSRIYHERTETKGTQLLMLDIGVPTKEAAQRGAFNVYKEIKDGLAGRGVPSAEIAFVHDYNEKTRLDLFEKMNNGDIRILLGSTSKAGVGLNIQKRLFAIHHIDVPWTPAGLEQRNGRIMRQGNDNPIIEEYRYIVPRTFDAYSWQLLENKSRFLGQAMSGDTSVREAEDVDGRALSAAEVKALATGDPRIMEKFQVDTEVQRLQRLLQSHETQQFNNSRAIAEIPVRINGNKKQMEILRADIETRERNKPEEFSITVGKKVYTDRKEGGFALNQALKTADNYQKVGTYNGFEILASQQFGSVFGNKGKYMFTPNYEAPAGTIQSMDSKMRHLEDYLESNQRSLEAYEKELRDRQAEAGKPFDKQAELDRLLARQSEIDKSLEVGKSADAAPASTEEEDPSGVTLDFLGLQSMYDMAARALRRIRARQAVPTAERAAQPTDTGIPEGPPDEGNKAINIRLDKLRTAPEVIDFIRQTARDNRADINAQRRGKQSFGDTKTAAQRLVDEGMVDPDALGRMKKGTALNAEELNAARRVMVATAEDAKQAARKAQQSGSVDDLIAFHEAVNRHTAVQKAVSGAVAEAGRALSQQRMAVEARRRQTRTALDEVLEHLGGREVSEEMARRLAEIDENDPVAAMRFLRDAQKYTTVDKIQAYWINSILSGPRTQIRNILGNITFGPVVQAPLRTLRGAIDPLVAKSQDRDREFYAREGIYGIKGYFAGMVDGAGKAAFIVRHGFEQPEAGKMDLPKGYQFTGKLAPFGYPGRALTAADAWFKVMSLRGELYAQAVRRGLKEGLSGDALKNRMAELIANPPEEMLDAAYKQSRYETFNDRPDGISRALIQLRNRTGLAGTLVIPFINTPWNILKTSAEFSPLGVARLRNEDVRESPEASNVLAKALLGSAMLVLFAILADQDRLTGAAPTNAAERDAFYNSGKQPFSLKIGNRWVAYNNAVGPMGMLMSAVAAFHDAFEDGKEVPSKRIAQAAAVIGKSIEQQSFFQGIQNLVEGLADPVNKGADFAENILQGFVPFSGLQRNLAQATDKTVRAPLGVYERIKAGLPILSKSVPPKVDALGRDVERRGGSGMAAFLPSPIPEDAPLSEVDAELYRLEQLGMRAPGYVGGQLTVESTKIPLRREERSEYQRLRGTLLRKTLEKVLDTEDYKDMTDEQKMAEVEDVMAEIQRYSRDQMLARIADRRLKRQQATTVPMELH